MEVSFLTIQRRFCLFPNRILIGAPKDDVHKIWVVDYNGDGLPDVILGDNVYKKNGSKFDYQHTNWFFYTNTGTVLKMQYQTKKNHILKVSHLGMVADINGDGVQRFIDTDKISQPQVAKFHPGWIILVCLIQ